MRNQKLVRMLFIAGLLSASWQFVAAHPLGNFTINHFSRIEVGLNEIKLRYVIDQAEIPTFQELQTIDNDHDGKASEMELKSYAQRIGSTYAEGLVLTVDGIRLPLKVVSSNARLQNGASGLDTLRIECDLIAASAVSASGRRLHLEDRNYSERIGWREMVAGSVAEISIFDSFVFGSSLTDELKSYPTNRLAAPLDERSAEFSFIKGPVPPSARALATRDGRLAAAQTRDMFAELIAVPQLTIAVVLLGLLIAMLLGGLHALSPGHGKTVVGAYLVGTRGTARHAAFLGLTVTITHTLGVFALGVVTLLASEYILPERLFPILSFGSGAIVVVIGFGLLARRLRTALEVGAHVHTDRIGPTRPHSHGGKVHSHLPPGANGSPISWRSLLALGISGGLLPCPSALVVLLAAIALHRVGYGLMLVVAFSIGLAGTLTLVGLAFVYAGRFLKASGKFDRATRILPVFSAFVISCAGLAICYEAFNQAGIQITMRFGSLFAKEPSFVSASALGILGLGLIFGLKHATEADHIVAVSTIVSEQRKLMRAALVGALWGLGHTTSLFIVGVIVLVMKISIPESFAGWLEFAVAVMIVVLGVIAFRRALRQRSSVHSHKHGHGGISHTHLHFHEIADTVGHSHGVMRLGIKPAVVGAMHGLAGSAALTLLVLTQISSPCVGVLYLLVFGAGSIVGMLLMSGLLGLPFVLSAKGPGKFQYQLQMLAGILSILFGLWYGYQAGLANIG